MSSTEFENWLEESYDKYDCSKCGEPLCLVSPDDLQLECYICSARFEFDSLEQAHLVLTDKCSNCCGRYDFPQHSVCVPGSWSYYRGIYDWAASEKDTSLLARKGRTDYWEGLVHFCDASQFVSIYKQRVIKASSTGYFGVPAVCLTEATIPNWKELQEVHGSFGFVFKKKDIIGLGGAPAAYLPEQVIKKQCSKGIAAELKPFINLLRIPTVTPDKTKYDFLHEREWRVPSDINFGAVQPFAVVFDECRPDVADWECIIEAAIEFQQLVPANERLTVDDVIALLAQIDTLDKSNLSAESDVAHAWLLRNGINTRDRLTDLVKASAVITKISDIYVQELGRNPVSPLDPVAVATWGAALFVNGLRDDVVQDVVTQIRMTPEYRQKHAGGGKPSQ